MERITYWKCRHCHGTGQVIRGCSEWRRAFKCDECDGTGNALVDGAAEQHRRDLSELRSHAP